MKQSQNPKSAAAKFCTTLLLLVLCTFAFLRTAKAQTSIGTFTSIEPKSQDEAFYIPNTHTFQLLINAGTPLTSGGILGVNSDFTGYVPKNGSSESGYLSINSEFVPGGVTILDISFNQSSKLWEVNNSHAVDFSDLGNFFVPGTVANCSGTVTPWGTIVTCEENDLSGDLTGDGYLDWGWNIEIDPATHSVIDQDNNGSPDKLWAMGRMRHENVVVSSDSQTVYFGDDDSGSGFVFKFICTNKADLSAGTLYVLKQSGTTGQWLQVANSSQADRNNTLDIADNLGATLFNRVEDVEIGPDGKVYFASTGNNKVYRFKDDGNTISQFEVFVDGLTYTIDYGTGTAQAGFGGPDNLAFDCEGNLWVMQDGGGLHMWMVRPGHTSANPDLEVFGNTPLDSEPTGITFSPDCRFMFISLQHPDNGNSQSVVDAAGRNVIFNRDATVVIARKEDLGPTTSMPPVLQPIDGLVIRHLYPNPVDDQLNIEMTSPKAGTAKFEAFDLKGSRVWIQSKRLQKGLNLLKFPTRTLATGNYILKINWGDQVITKKFTK